LEKGQGLFTNAGGEVARAPEGESSGADAKSEQPVCEEAVASTLGGLQELELFALFAEHFHVEVAVGLDPVLVDLDGESPNEPQRALLVGKNANDMGAALDLLIEPLKHIGALEVLVVFSG
jgi:hypothetical protein